MISGPRITGQLIVPRQHIGGLEELSLPRRAQVLAAIRRATAAVGSGSTSVTAPGGRVHGFAGICVPRMLPGAAVGRDGSLRSPSISNGSQRIAEIFQDSGITVTSAFSYSSVGIPASDARGGAPRSKKPVRPLATRSPAQNIAKM